jgi:glycosyltransferase involved in cell wall biosynthesis
MNKRLVFILGSMGKGGAERVVANLSNHLCKKYKITIILLLNNNVSYELDKEIQILDFSNKNKTRLMQLPNWIYNITKFIMKLDKQDSVIISFAARINIITLIGKILAGNNIPLIISERNDPKHDGRNFLERIMTYLLYPFSNKIVFQTKYASTQFPQKIRKNSLIIPNPVFFTTHVENGVKKEVIVNVGRLSEQKNQALLIEAFKKVSVTNPNYKLIIYGEGPLRPDLEALVEKLDLHNKVELPGIVDDIQNKMREAKVFVLSSNYEGQSNALLEAMGMGIACISTNVSGVDEIINENSGILVSKNCKEELSSAIINLIEHDELRKILEENAKNKVGEFSTPKISLKWEELIDSLI